MNVFCRCIENFEILHGELHGLSDTMAFLKSLSTLASSADLVKNTEKHLLQEQVAAAGLFNWEVLVLPIICCVFFFSFKCFGLFWLRNINHQGTWQFFFLSLLLCFLFEFENATWGTVILVWHECYLLACLLNNELTINGPFYCL